MTLGLTKVLLGVLAVSATGISGTYAIKWLTPKEENTTTAEQGNENTETAAQTSQDGHQVSESRSTESTTNAHSS